MVNKLSCKLNRENKGFRDKLPRLDLKLYRVPGVIGDIFIPYDDLPKGAGFGSDDQFPDWANKAMRFIMLRTPRWVPHDLKCFFRNSIWEYFSVRHFRRLAKIQRKIRS